MIDDQEEEEEQSSKYTFRDLGYYILIMTGIAAAVIALIYMTGAGSTEWEEVNIEGVTLNIPTYMELSGSTNNETSSSREYMIDYDTSVSRIYIEVYKNKSVEQVFTTYKSEYEIYTQETITIGNYSGIKFNFKASGSDTYFVFEKNGKTVLVIIAASNYEELLPKIIN